MPEEMGEQETETSRESFVALPLSALGGSAARPVGFPLYLETGAGRHVLYCEASARLGRRELARLQREGIDRLHVRSADRERWARRVEEGLEAVLRDRSAPVEVRAALLHEVALEVAGELLAPDPGREALRRMRRVMSSATRLMQREGEAFTALRSVLEAGETFRAHSLNVGFLSMGVARRALGADPIAILHAGLAGLLHDVGRADAPEGEEDPGHVERGYRKLEALEVPPVVRMVVLLHHERCDGTGYPRGLADKEIPLLARLVAVVDSFDRIHAAREGERSVFASLEILARVHKGEIDPAMARALVELFGEDVRRRPRASA